MSYLLRFLEGIGLAVTYAATRFMAVVRSLGRAARDHPGQILAPIGVLTCSALSLTIADDTIFDAPLMGTQAILLLIQFRSVFRTVKENKIRRLKDDKERLQQFFEHAGPNGIPGSIRFLSIYKDPWLRAWYYYLKGITRLSLYRYGDSDDTGSHTKFKVNAKELFHLQLKGCVDTEDPDKAVEGIDYVAANYLTK